MSASDSGAISKLSPRHATAWTASSVMSRRSQTRTLITRYQRHRRRGLVSSSDHRSHAAAIGAAAIAISELSQLELLSCLMWCK